ncbi:MAG TPA: hypothetical protein VM884_06990 [Flavisolibacter sp.]|jgi:hypothetical protein|nr:hypothetical protein [Flavisolibacter sp.]
MKKQILQLSLVALLVTGFSCKGKDKDKTTNTTTTTTTNTASPEVAPTMPPVEVAGDAVLRQGVADVTKDVKGLTATVQNGVILLSGTISKEDNMRITPTLNSLQPKRIDRTNLNVQ